MFLKNLFVPTWEIQIRSGVLPADEFAEFVAFDPPDIFEFSGSCDELYRHLPAIGSPWGDGAVLALDVVRKR